MDSVAKRNDTLFYVSALGAYCATETGRFRRKHMMQFVWLFSDWIDRETTSNLDPKQVGRYLDELAEGKAKGLPLPLDKGRDERGIYYAVAEPVEVSIERLVGATDDYHEVLLLACILTCFEAPAADGVASVRSPRSLRLLQQAIRSVERRIAAIEERIAESADLVAITQRLLEAGLPYNQIVARLNALRPYRLHAQEPYADLMSRLPDVFREVEIRFGFSMRARVIFEPMLREQRARLAHLTALSRAMRRGFGTMSAADASSLAVGGVVELCGGGSAGFCFSSSSLAHGCF